MDPQKMSIDGKTTTKFETGFKHPIVQEVESGLFSVSAASRKHQIYSSCCDNQLADIQEEPQKRLRAKEEEIVQRIHERDMKRGERKPLTHLVD